MSVLVAPAFADLLTRALTEPDIVSRAYTAFHGYSIGNQILAFVQCLEREIALGPIATFKRWFRSGRGLDCSSPNTPKSPPGAVGRYVRPPSVAVGLHL